jgi:hypothetical protein
MQEGVVRLLRMRGWHVEQNDRRLDIFVENRKFSAVVVDRKNDIPIEDHALPKSIRQGSARIVAELEAGATPWVKPWSATLQCREE